MRRLAIAAAALVLLAAPAAHAEDPPVYEINWGSLGTAPGQFNNPYGIALDAAGNVYVVDFANDRIQKFDADGGFLLTWGVTGSGAGQFNGAMGLDIDASGNIYVADRLNDRIQKFDSGGAFLLEWGTTGTGDGQFDQPRDVAIDASGNVYVTELGNDRVQKFDANGNFLLQWGGLGTANGQFMDPHGIDVDPGGNVYVCEFAGNRVQKFDADGNFLLKWGSAGTGDGQFQSALGLDVDGAGNVYVTDYVGDRIQKFTGVGAYLWKLSVGALPAAVAVNGSGQMFYSSHGLDRIYRLGNLPAEPPLAQAPPEFLGKWGGLNSPYSAAVNSSGDVWISEYSGHRIQRFDRDGNPLAILGAFGTGLGQFNTPRGVAVDAADNLYVADGLNRRVQKFDADGNFLLWCGGYGSGDGQFEYPESIAVGPGGDIYVSDEALHRIQKFTPTGTFLLKWGTHGSGAGQFNQPRGIGVDASGNVYVADASNQRVQKFDADGNFLAMWGSNGTGNGQFQDPSGVVVDGNGDIVVADPGRDVIQKFDSNGNFLTIWGGSGLEDGRFSYAYGLASAANGDVYITDSNRVQKFGPVPANVAAVDDVGGDQGGQVRLTFDRSGRDLAIATDPVLAYEVYRRIDAAQAARWAELPEGVVAELRQRRTEALPGERLSARGAADAGWDFLGSIPAHTDTTYSVIVPTLADSTAAAGILYSVFFVRAATADPSDFHDSAPDSGYSVDNLAPAPPANLQLAGADLSWDEAPDADFQYFTVYGSPTGDPQDAVVIDHVTTPAFDVTGAPYSWYLVTATDFAGNEGDAALAGNPAVDAPAVSPGPTVFALRVPRPNPFRDLATIAFDVPAAGRASVSIHDVTGRLVRRIVDGEVAAGSHRAEWTGTDTSGRSVSPGVYFVRMDAGSFRAVRRVVRLR